MHYLLILILSCFSAFAHAVVTEIEYQQQTIDIFGERFIANVPRGYKLEFLTGDLSGPRIISFADNSDMFIGSGSDNVYRLRPPYKKPQVYVELDDYPHSVAFRGKEILIARTSGVYSAKYDPKQDKLLAGNIKLLVALPGGGGHNSRTLAVGPDERIYVSLGISGNCSDQYIGNEYPFSDRRGGVLVLDETSAKPYWKPYASGLRNPVGFDWHPETLVMYASNNGPDHHGFEKPREYFSRLEEGSFHGMPWFQFDGEDIRRDDCIGGRPPRPAGEVSKPVVTFDARNAPMAVAFVPKGAMDRQFENMAIVALRGSWGTKPSGSYYGDKSSRRHPKLVTIRFDDGKAVQVDDLVTGFQLKNGERWARPVGVRIGPDGALYFTSDGGIHGLFRLKKVNQ